jgi:L-seryl-tRNA(Ser) seleniumtransferase
MMTLDDLQNRTEKMKNHFIQLAPQFEVSLRDDFSQVGGGTMPEVQLPTILLGLKHNKMSSASLAKKLRTEYQPAIVVRIQNEELLIDLRTVEEEEEEIILNALIQLGN